MACFLFLSWAFLPAGVCAQEEPASTADEEDVISLAPYEVASKAPTGYRVTTLTTTTRLNTALEDISQTISVVSADFMDDIGATDFKDAIAYMPAISERHNVPDGSKIRGLRTTRSY